MNAKKVLNELSMKQDKIALATCNEGQANVRIVNYIMKNDVIYFISFKTCQKCKEIESNHRVGITSIPNSDQEGHFKSKSAIAKISNLSIADVKDDFLKKIPQNEDIFRVPNELLNLYEITCNNITVTLDLDNSEEISFKDERCQ